MQNREGLVHLDAQEAGFGHWEDGYVRYNRAAWSHRIHALQKRDRSTARRRHEKSPGFARHSA